MSIDKESPDIHDAAIGNESDHVDEIKGNAADRADMYRMGKTQEMRVRASFYPIGEYPLT